MAARVPQRHIALILARDLAANVSSAMLLVDENGDLVYFNEPAERLLGRPYAEAQMSRADLAKAFKPVDEGGAQVPIQELPIAMAFRTGLPSRSGMWIETGDGRRPYIQVLGIPLFARVGDLVGGLAVFWESTPEG